MSTTNESLQRTSRRFCPKFSNGIQSHGADLQQPHREHPESLQDDQVDVERPKALYHNREEQRNALRIVKVLFQVLPESMESESRSAASTWLAHVRPPPSGRDDISQYGEGEKQVEECEEEVFADYGKFHLFLRNHALVLREPCTYNHQQLKQTPGHIRQKPTVVKIRDRNVEQRQNQGGQKALDQRAEDLVGF